MLTELENYLTAAVSIAKEAGNELMHLYQKHVTLEKSVSLIIPMLLKLIIVRIG